MAAKLVIQGRAYDPPDPETFTLGECEILEDVAGLSLTELQAALGKRSAKAMIALAFIVMRRDDPTLDVEAVRELKLSEIAQTGDDEPEEDEAGPPSEGAEPGEPGI